MDTADSVAIVALVVSLIALLVTGIQLLAGLTSTAEGYRRCSKSVNGPWTRLRRRRSNFSELQFEVEYGTPHFAITDYDDDSLQELKTRFGPAYFIDHELTATPTVPSSRTPLALRNAGLLAYNAVIRYLFASLTEDDLATVIKQTVVPPLVKQLKELYGKTEIGLEVPLGTSSRGRKTVPWFPMKPRQHVQVSWSSLAMALNYVHQPQYHSLRTWGHTGGRHTAIAVRYWNWDFMPPDLLRPLATSTLIAMIIIGLRLNMKWRRIDLENRVFLADGNGLSLTSFDIQGLGIAFRFDIGGFPKEVEHRLTTEAADKMMFGIIPGAHSPLVMRDIELAFDDGISFKPLWSSLGFGSVVHKDIINSENWHLKNEVITLLCPFLPDQGPEDYRHLFPAWSGNAHSCFHFWEGRIGFLKGLQKQIAIETQSPSTRSTLTKV